MLLPKVSIIVPCYNQAVYLDDCLNSILDQTYQNWECFIVNDGSPDNTEEIAEVWCLKDKRFHYIFQENLGVSAARNNGIRSSDGAFIQFLDADDQLELEKIEHQVHFLELNLQVDIVYGTSRYFFDGNEELFATHYKGFCPSIELDYNDKNQLTVINKTNISTICATLYRKRVFENGLKFKDIPYEDFLFHIECSFNQFIFHFERFKNSHCLIRMTKGSQMQKHSSLSKNDDLFYSKVSALQKEFNFQSSFCEFQPHGYIHQRFSMKSIFINITPPIILKAIQSLQIRLFIIFLITSFNIR